MISIFTVDYSSFVFGSLRGEHSSMQIPCNYKSMPDSFLHGSIKDWQMNWYKDLHDEIEELEMDVRLQRETQDQRKILTALLGSQRVCSPHSYNIEKRCNTARRQIFMGSIKLQKGRGIRRAPKS